MSKTEAKRSIQRIIDIRVSKRIISFAGLSLLAFILSLLVFPAPYGLRFHFFQFAIFLAGSVLGPLYGGATGFIGSFGPSFLRADPYILLYNSALGIATGIFSRYFRPAIAALMAYFLIHLPLMILIGRFVQNVPKTILVAISIILAIEDIICAILADISSVKLKRWLNK